MELKRLRYFVTAADEMHVGRAAERLGIAQPALSQQIKVLEAAMGVRLFDRVNRGIRLTAVGEAFLPEARAAIAQAERAIAIARGTARGELGRIEIGYVGSAMVEPELPKLIGDYRSRFPSVGLRLRKQSVPEQLDRLEQRRLDVAFIRGMPAELPRTLRARVFSHTRLVAAIPADRPAAGAASPRLADLAGERFIVMQDTDRQSFFADVTRAECRAAGFEPDIDLRVEDIASMIGLVAAGFGVGLVPALIGSLAMPNVAFRHLSDLDGLIELFLVERRSEPSPAVRQFLAMAATASAGG